MPNVSFENLLIIASIAVAAPLLLGYQPRLRIPSVVVEIIAGVLVGPAVLGWVEVDLPVQVVAIIGLAFLLFLAGLEIDLQRLRGRLLTLALLGYVITIAVGMPIGLIASSIGWLDSPFLLAVALSATSLGLVVPVLKDAGKIDTDVGQSTIAAATVADFAAIVLLSLAFSMGGGGTGSRLVLLTSFAVLIVVVTIAVTRAGRSMRLGDVLTRLQDTTAEIRVRLAVVLLVAFVVFAERFGLESILGAFLAGAVVAGVDRDSSSHPHFRTKLEAMGYGFLVPVFFIASGVRLDVGGLVSDPGALLLVPVLLLALLLARGIPALLYLNMFDRRSTVAAALLQATSLPFIVTATQIGVETGRMSPTTAAALILAGLLSVLVFPSISLGLLRGTGQGGAVGPGSPAGSSAVSTGGAAVGT